MKTILFPLPKRLLRSPVPRIGGIRLCVEGRLPHLHQSKPLLEDYDNPADSDPIREVPEAREEIAPEVKTSGEPSKESEKVQIKALIDATPVEQPPAKPIRHVEVTLVPTPRKRAPREPKIEPAQAAPPEPRPLKVIRKRSREAPKIFEILPRAYADAMHGGIRAKAGADDEG